METHLKEKHMKLENLTLTPDIIDIFCLSGINWSMNLYGSWPVDKMSSLFSSCPE